MDENKLNPIKELANNGIDFEVCGNQDGQATNFLDFYKFTTANMDSIPWLKLEKAGWIEPGRNISALAPLIQSIHTVGNRNSLFRKSKTANDFLVYFWSARVELKAKQIFIESENLQFDKERFNQDALFEISRLSPDINVLNKLPEILANYGIILVYEIAFPGIKSDGLVTKLDNGIPVVGLSLRYKRLDYFWFTLLHELSHIILHYDQIDSPIIENLDITDQELTERQADRLALNTFISRKDWNRCPPKYEKTDESIITFAKKMGIHPAIVAGRLQKETDRFDHYRKIIDEIDIMDIIRG